MTFIKLPWVLGHVVVLNKIELCLSAIIKQVFGILFYGSSN